MTNEVEINTEKITDTGSYATCIIIDGQKYTIKDPNALTEHQDISGKANTADLATVATTGSYTDLTDTPDLTVYAKTSDVPTDDHINELITTALNNVENGSY